jgi:effector-binding domain-containing protein
MKSGFFRSVLAGFLMIAGLAAAAAAQDLEVAVKDVESFPYLAMAHKGPYSDMATVIGELVGAMQAQGLFSQVRGPLVGVYFNTPGTVAPEELSWEVGFVVAAQATAGVPLVKKIWEHRTVAAALHVGPYDAVGTAIGKIMGWIAAHGYVAAGPVLERYLDQNPSAVKPEALRTEIWIPCKKK